MSEIANPITDQYLATVRAKLGGACKPDCQGTDHVVIERTIEVMRDALPGVAPAIVGEVMLHMAMILSELNTNGYVADLPSANRARFLINCGALAGTQLITGVDYSRKAR